MNEKKQPRAASIRPKANRETRAPAPLSDAKASSLSELAGATPVTPASPVVADAGERDRDRDRDREQEREAAEAPRPSARPPRGSVRPARTSARPPRSAATSPTTRLPSARASAPTTRLPAARANAQTIQLPASRPNAKLPVSKREAAATIERVEPPSPAPSPSSPSSPSPEPSKSSPMVVALEKKPRRKSSGELVEVSLQPARRDPRREDD